MNKLRGQAVAAAGLRLLPCALLMLATGAALAQDDDEEAFDEITVTGTQIKGAKISDALAVSVVSAEDIEILGVESGDELLAAIPEMGQNFFSEMDTAGGINSARGDVGAINMRNLGTGNTLVLLNGRRLVNMATYQTEEVGGSFVPVNSVNSTHIPVYGVERIEVLRDGASAIYGADAVAGVVNTVLKDDFEGFTVRLRYDDYDNIPRNDESLSVEWGDSFNGGATHVGVFATHYRRDPVHARDDPRWADSDYRRYFPVGSPYHPWGADGIEGENPATGINDDSTIFRNDSANSLFGQFDIVPSVGSTHSLRVNDVVDNLGEFETYPVGDPRCQGGFQLNAVTCIHEDGQGTYRYNLSEVRDLVSDLERTTVFGYLNHEMDAGTEFFADFYYYTSDTVRIFDPSTPLTAVPLRMGAANYYNPLGPVGSPNRLPDPTGVLLANVPDSGYELNIDNYRFATNPRATDNGGDALRFLAGLRGTEGDWDWESALVWSEATRDDITHNRLSNTLITEALFDPTPAAFNPFEGGANSNIERAYIDVYRKGRTTLTLWDIKFSNADIFEMPAGPVGFVAGYEYRRENFVDDRDPRLDGTINFTSFGGDTYPLVSDVVGSSPTPDNRGSRTTTSLFGELQVPLHRTLDVQLAARFEDFDDIGSTTVGKIAFGWRPVEMFLVRGSWSEAFRAPNLITINEQFVARSNTLNDWVCFYGKDEGDLPSNEDCDYSVQRQATGSKELVPEESTNSSIGLVLQPTEGLTFTVDFWKIEKDDTIGLFGEENHMLYDLVLRLAAGTANCADPTTLGNPLVIRQAHDPADTDAYLAAGICPVGRVSYVTDNYTNLDTRTLEGYDVGLYYDFETGIGDFNLSYNGAFYTKFEQTASSPRALAVLAAKESDPTIIYPLIGLGDLLGINGNQEDRHSATVSWRKGDWSAGVTGFRISEFDQILSNGDAFPIPSMTTYNAKIDYSFDVGDVGTRVRLGLNNFTNERAPLADDSYGFFDDAHRDFGRYYYVDVRMQF
jgi:outer membrane receptor protein involved in Fe transport